MFYIASERSLVIEGVADETLEAKVRQRWIVIAPERRGHRARASLRRSLPSACTWS